MGSSKFPKTLTNRASYARGQLNAVIRMMNENRSFYEVFILLLAVKGVLDKLIYPHFDKELRAELLLKVNRLLQNQNLSGQSQNLLAQIKKRLAKCTTAELPNLWLLVTQIEIATN